MGNKKSVGKQHGKGEERRENSWVGNKRVGKEQGKGRERAMEWQERMENTSGKMTGRVQKKGGKKRRNCE